MVSRKCTERHVRAGTAYFWAITVLAATGFTSAGADSASMAMSVLTGIACCATRPTSTCFARAFGAGKRPDQH
jgi:hypothetical protein